MERVGIRELRQNLSVYLRRIREGGDSIEVTEHGHPVALLTPLPITDDPYERMIAEGRLIPARESWETLPPPIGPMSTDGTDVLQEQREERL